MMSIVINQGGTAASRTVLTEHIKATADTSKAIQAGNDSVVWYIFICAHRNRCQRIQDVVLAWHVQANLQPWQTFTDYFKTSGHTLFGNVFCSDVGIFAKAIANKLTVHSW